MGHSGSSEGRRTSARAQAGPARRADEAVQSSDPSAESTPLGRRARKARATRLALFEAGLAAFEHRPLGVVSVLDITEASDVAKGVFYLHFRGKDEYLIALWEFVQGAFLAGAAERVDPCRSRRARLEGATAYFFGRIEGAARECRFWLRMASYFGDEIGEPGRMHRLRQEYLRQLAVLLAGAPPSVVGAPELHVASVVDGACWGLISRALQLDASPLDEAGFVRAVAGAVRALERERLGEGRCGSAGL